MTTVRSAVGAQESKRPATHGSPSIPGSARGMPRGDGAFATIACPTAKMDYPRIPAVIPIARNKIHWVVRGRLRTQMSLWSTQRSTRSVTRSETLRTLHPGRRRRRFRPVASRRTVIFRRLGRHLTPTNLARLGKGRNSSVGSCPKMRLATSPSALAAFRAARTTKLCLRRGKGHR